MLYQITEEVTFMEWAKTSKETTSTARFSDLHLINVPSNLGCTGGVSYVLYAHIRTYVHTYVYRHAVL